MKNPVHNSVKKTTYLFFSASQPHQKAELDSGSKPTSDSLAARYSLYDFPSDSDPETPDTSLTRKPQSETHRKNSTEGGKQTFRPQSHQTSTVVASTSQASSSARDLCQEPSSEKNATTAVSKETISTENSEKAQGKPWTVPFEWNTTHRKRVL